MNSELRANFFFRNHITIRKICAMATEIWKDFMLNPDEGINQNVVKLEERKW